MCSFHRSDLKWVCRDCNPTTMAIRAISGHFPDLLIACDVCLCPYTDHGHCGIFRPDGFIDNEKSIAQLAAISRKFVEAGAHVIAPSGTGAGERVLFIPCNFISSQEDAECRTAGGGNRATFWG